MFHQYSHESLYTPTQRHWLYINYRKKHRAISLMSTKINEQMSYFTDITPIGYITRYITSKTITTNNWAYTNWWTFRVFFSQAKNLQTKSIKQLCQMLKQILTKQFNRQMVIWRYTSFRSFFISVDNSSHCCVYCHLAVFSLSTTCSKWTCFCSSSSFCSNNLLKL